MARPWFLRVLLNSSSFSAIFLSISCLTCPSSSWALRTLFSSASRAPSAAPTAAPTAAPSQIGVLKVAPTPDSPSDKCENGTVFTVFQKKNNRVEFAEVQLCGGASPVNCYIDDTCEEPTTTITSTTKTSTTTTTTTLVYECHCKVFVDGQGPGCKGKCCTSKGNEGGVGYDSDCKTETSEEGCTERTNGAGEQFCLYKTTTYWNSVAR